jgi:4-hydroxybenzoyl-CoA reductase subunit beta
VLPLADVDYHAPDRLDDALALLAAPGSVALAGGTDLVPSMKMGLHRPARLVSLRRLGLRGVRVAAELVIGAGATLRELQRSESVQRHLPALAAACATVGTPTIQNAATLGGNLLLDTRCVYYNQPAGWRAQVGGCLKADGAVCHVAPRQSACWATQSSDTVPVLWLADARLRVVDLAGEREVPVRGLFGPDGRTWRAALPPGAVVTEIRVPLAVSEIRHEKVRLRQAIDFGAVLVAVTARDGAWEAVIGAVGPQPIAVSAADPEALAEAAARACYPLGTQLSPAWWRKRMVRVAVQRAAAALGH